MRAPEFWQRRGLTSLLLSPLGAVIAGAGSLRRRWTRPGRVEVPVICVGNLVVGGAGKTPVTLALADIAIALGRRPHLLTRGYGGELPGPVQVDPAVHDAKMVGDEALLLAAKAPTWVARDRSAGARAAVAAGAEIILMDDGLQNPGLYHDWDIIVVDGSYGFGNGRLMPAGPLRERIAGGVARARFAVVLGADRPDIVPLLGDRLTVLRACLIPDTDPDLWRGQRVVAFAGIGRPAKFFDTLRSLGAKICAKNAFSDHHPYTAADIAALDEQAVRLGARLITTAKDYVRLPPAVRHRIAVLPVTLKWQEADRTVLTSALATLLGERR